MAIYYYPSWRRIIFALVLVVLMIVSMAPSVSQGTVTIRIYGSTPKGVISHAYVGVSKIELHEVGFGDTTGWVSITKSLTPMDLISSHNQSFPQPVTSTLVHSGRYDWVRITFSNATLVLGSHSTPVIAPSQITSPVVVIIPPNGVGDVQFIMGLNYLAAISQPPSLIVNVVEVRSV